MALVVANRVQETTTTTGTGTVTLAGAVAGYQSFAAIGNGNTTYYTLTSGNNWEVGIGTYTASGTTLARTTVLASSAGGTTKITLSGTSNVFVTYPSDKALYTDASGNAIALGTPASGTVTNLTGTASININGTVGATTPGTGAFTTLSTTGALTYGGVTLSNSVTGTGSMVLSASPTLTGTLTGAAANFSGATTASTLALGGATLGTNALAVSGHLLLEGVTSTGATGTGKLVFSASPTLSGTVTGPDSGTWGSGGLTSISKLCVGTSSVFNSNFIASIGNGSSQTGLSINCNSSYALGLINAGFGAYIGVDGSAQNFAFQDGAGTIRATISTSTGAYTPLSDATKKNVREKQTDYRSAIASLWIGDYDWKETGEHGFGVLAQQAYDVMPEHLGTIIGEKFCGAEPGTFGYLALWGVKDIYGLIAGYEARIAALEAKETP